MYTDGIVICCRSEEVKEVNLKRKYALERRIIKIIILKV